MALKKINDLSLAGAVAGAMQLETDTGGATANKVNFTQVDTYILSGKTGGRTLYGGDSASENLTLESTSDSTKGSILMPGNGNALSIGTQALTQNIPVYLSLKETGWAAPAIVGNISDGDKFILWNASNYKASIGIRNVGGAADNLWFQSHSVGTAASMTFYLGNSGASYNMMHINQTTGFTWNDGQVGGLDFKIKGDVDANLFFVHSLAGGISIGSADLLGNYKVAIHGNVGISPSSSYFIGDYNTDNTWRIYRDGNDLTFARRESGVYVEKGRITA